MNLELTLIFLSNITISGHKMTEKNDPKDVPKENVVKDVVINVVKQI